LKICKENRTFVRMFNVLFVEKPENNLIFEIESA